MLSGADVTEIRQRRGEGAVWVGHCCCAGRVLSDDVTLAVVVGSCPSAWRWSGWAAPERAAAWCVWPRRGGSWIVLCATMEVRGVVYPALLTLAAVSCICVMACWLPTRRAL